MFSGSGGSAFTSSWSQTISAIIQSTQANIASVREDASVFSPPSNIDPHQFQQNNYQMPSPLNKNFNPGGGGARWISVDLPPKNNEYISSPPSFYGGNNTYMMPSKISTTPVGHQRSVNHFPRQYHNHHQSHCPECDNPLEFQLSVQNNPSTQYQQQQQQQYQRNHRSRTPTSSEHHSLFKINNYPPKLNNDDYDQQNMMVQDIIEQEIHPSMREKSSHQQYSRSINITGQQVEGGVRDFSKFQKVYPQPLPTTSPYRKSLHYSQLNKNQSNYKENFSQRASAMSNIETFAQIFNKIQAIKQEQVQNNDKVELGEQKLRNQFLDYRNDIQINQLPQFDQKLNDFKTETKKDIRGCENQIRQIESRLNEAELQIVDKVDKNMHKQLNSFEAKIQDDRQKFRKDMNSMLNQKVSVEVGKLNQRVENATSMNSLLSERQFYALLNQFRLANIDERVEKEVEEVNSRVNQKIRQMKKESSRRESAFAEEKLRSQSKSEINSLKQQIERIKTHVEQKNTIMEQQLSDHRVSIDQPSQEEKIGFNVEKQIYPDMQTNSNRFLELDQKIDNNAKQSKNKETEVKKMMKQMNNQFKKDLASQNNVIQELKLLIQNQQIQHRKEIEQLMENNRKAKNIDDQEDFNKVVKSPVLSDYQTRTQLQKPRALVSFGGGSGLNQSNQVIQQDNGEQLESPYFRQKATNEQNVRKEVQPKHIEKNKVKEVKNEDVWDLDQFDLDDDNQEIEKDDFKVQEDDKQIEEKTIEKIPNPFATNQQQQQQQQQEGQRAGTADSLAMFPSRQQQPSSKASLDNVRPSTYIHSEQEIYQKFTDHLQNKDLLNKPKEGNDVIILDSDFGDDDDDDEDQNVIHHDNVQFKQKSNILDGRQKNYTPIQQMGSSSIKVSQIFDSDENQMNENSNEKQVNKLAPPQMKDEEDAIIQESKELMQGLNNKLGLSNEEKRLTNVNSSSQFESKQYTEDIKSDKHLIDKISQAKDEKVLKLEGQLQFDDDDELSDYDSVDDKTLKQQPKAVVEQQDKEIQQTDRQVLRESQITVDEWVVVDTPPQKKKSLQDNDDEEEETKVRSNIKSGFGNLDPSELDSMQNEDSQISASWGDLEQQQVEETKTIESKTEEYSRTKRRQLKESKQEISKEVIDSIFEDQIFEALSLVEQKQETI